jgi:hypothetical protein
LAGRRGIDEGEYEMGQLAKDLAQWRGTDAAAAALERAVYDLAKAVFAGGYYDAAQADADRAARKYGEAVARGAGGRGKELAIVAYQEEGRVVVLDTDADGEPFVRWTITPAMIRA